MFNIQSSKDKIVDVLITKESGLMKFIISCWDVNCIFVFCKLLDTTVDIWFVSSISHYIKEAVTS